MASSLANHESSSERSVSSPTRRIGHVEICDDTLPLARPCHPSLCTFSKEGRGLGRAPLPTATTGTLPDSSIWVIKLHGSVDRRVEHLILTRSDYRRHYRSNRHRISVW